MSTMNLLPRDYVQRRSQHRANVICIVLLAVVLGSVAGAGLVSERSSRNTRQVCDRINRAYEDAAKLIDEVRQLEAQKRTMLVKAETSAALMERLPRSYVLAMLADALPTGASLTTLKLDTRAVRSGPSPQTPRAKHAVVANLRGRKMQATASNLSVTMDIKGKAATDVQVARFIASLAKHNLTEMVDLSYSKQAAGGGEAFREFHLRVRLKPNADALDAAAGQTAHAPSPDRSGRGGGA